MDLWGQVAAYHDYECTDPRDRVFGLLALADGRASSTLRPDSPISTTQVFTQLLDLYAFNPQEDPVWWRETLENSYSTAAPWEKSRFDMTGILQVLASMRMDSEQPGVTELVTSRKSLHYDYPVDAGLTAAYLFKRHCSLHRVSVKVCLHCTVSQNDAGKLIAPLCIDRSITDDSSHDFEYVHDNNKGDATEVENPVGKVVALVDKRTRVGDIILCFSLHGRRDPAVAGLVVRPANGALHIIVGQAIFDLGVRPYSKNHCSCTDLGRSKCECEQEEYLHPSEASDWALHMSLQDVLLFLAQDLTSQRPQKSRDHAIVTEVVPHREHTARRFQLSVTSDLLSSYVLREQKE